MTTETEQLMAESSKDDRLSWPWSHCNMQISACFCDHSA